MCHVIERKNANLHLLLRVSRCPWLTKVISPAVPLYNGLVFLFVLANFSMATFMDPGVYPRGLYACMSLSVKIRLSLWQGCKCRFF